MKKLDDYVVDYNLIIQKKKDFFNAIDSNFLTTNTIAQEIMNDWISPSDNEEVFIGRLQAVGRFWNGDKQILRFPISYSNNVESRNWDDPRTVSRDNSLGCLVASALVGRRKSNKQFAIDTIKRFSFFQNTHTVKMEKKIVPDFAGPGSWSVILRATGGARGFLYYPIYLFFDLFLLISTLFFVLKNKFYDNDYNSPLYHMVTTAFYCSLDQPTLFSRLNRWVLVKFCPVNKKFDNGEHPIITQLMEYSRMYYDPPIYETTKKLLKRYGYA